jgi:phosphoribosyl 1,2-cyclic phosphate phosphodiesterase
MKVTFLGTGTSMGVPTAGNYSYHPETGDPRDERLRCSVWIQTETHSILIDVGPDFRTQTLRSGLKEVDALFLTHEHIDHIGGLDDLRPFVFKRDAPIPVWLTEECKESVTKRFNYMFGEDSVSGSVRLDFTIATEPFMLGETTVTPLPAKHGEMKVLGYRFDDFCYLTDINHVPDSTIALMRGAKHVVLGALRWEPKHRTHFTISETLEIARKIDAEHTWLVHMSSKVVHESANSRLPERVKLAYDQMILSL